MKTKLFLNFISHEKILLIPKCDLSKLVNSITYMDNDSEQYQDNTIIINPKLFIAISHGKKHESIISPRRPNDNQRHILKLKDKRVTKMLSVHHSRRYLSGKISSNFTNKLNFLKQCQLFCLFLTSAISCLEAEVTYMSVCLCISLQTHFLH